MNSLIGGHIGSGTALLWGLCNTHSDIKLTHQFKIFPDWAKLIVVDDGSEDDTGEVAQSFKDPRIRLIKYGYCQMLRWE